LGKEVLTDRPYQSAGERGEGEGDGRLSLGPRREGERAGDSALQAERKRGGKEKDFPFLFFKTKLQAHL
jgi:hypothetical protein